jgi:hypothetical protein
MFGRPISGKKLKQFIPTINRAGTFRSVMRVQGMGDLNACAIAQRVHEQILEKANCLKPVNKLVYGIPVPSSPLWEGVFIDDHVVVFKVPRSQFKHTDVGPDVSVINNSVQVYEDVDGLVRAEEKEIRYAEQN